jgi:methylated-DNA-[protein]-cysteine S-methyltransferase
MYYKIIESRLGRFGIIWRRHRRRVRIVRIVLPNKIGSIRKLYRGARTGTCPAIDLIARELRGFLAGRPIRISIKYCDRDVLYPFQKTVLRFERMVPYGRVTTYGWLAKKINRAHAARAVGTALARNPFPIIIPCHRTIRSNGSLGGFSGGLRLKRRLLEMEGVGFDRRGRVESARLW